MAIERKTIIDQIEVLRDGSVQVRFGKLLLDAGAEIDCKWHRTVISPGADVTKQMTAVDTHLMSLWQSKIDDAVGLTRLKKIVSLVHTPDVVKAYLKRLESNDGS